MKAGGVFAVAVVAATIEYDGGDAGSGDKVEDVLIPGGEVAVPPIIGSDPINGV